MLLCLKWKWCCSVSNRKTGVHKSVLLFASKQDAPKALLTTYATDVASSSGLVALVFVSVKGTADACTCCRECQASQCCKLATGYVRLQMHFLLHAFAWRNEGSKVMRMCPAYPPFKLLEILEEVVEPNGGLPCTHKSVMAM
eukprot:1159148-Pelagomonas_calceolata.AAC.9